MNKRDLVSLVGDQLRAQLPPQGLDYVLVCCSQDGGGRAFWQSEASRREIILPMLHGYIQALQEQQRFNESDPAAE